MSADGRPPDDVQQDGAQQRVVLVGPMGSGKSAVGPLLARLLGVPFLDTDRLVEEAAAARVAEVFRVQGEAGFRAAEEAAIAQACAHPAAVVATGGGALLRPANRTRLFGWGRVVGLTAGVDVLAERVARDGSSRPLLVGRGTQDAAAAGAEATAALRDLLARRAPYYRLPEATFDTGGRTPGEVAESIRRHLRQEAGWRQVSVDLPGEAYPVLVGAGTHGALGSWLRVRAAELGTTCRNAVLAGPRVVLERFGPTIGASLDAAGIPYATAPIPDGEVHKTMATVAALHDALVERHADRTTWVLALGGGVAGDTVGFAAATFMRGLPLVQVPTTLLAQVDAGIGGKTGVNHPLGKNLIGAFYQPVLVVCDVEALSTLPDAVYRDGFAEVVKYGMLLGDAWLRRLEAQTDALRARERAELVPLVAACVEAKARVVAQDARDHGPRQLLNLGHTFGHALESLGEYSRWTHGQAVAIGLVLACRLAEVRGGWPGGAARVAALLERLGLPTRYGGVTPEDIWERCRGDKKAEAGRIRWIVPRAPGDVVVSDAPSREQVLAVLAERREG